MLVYAQRTKTLGLTYTPKIMTVGKRPASIAPDIFVISPVIGKQ